MPLRTRYGFIPEDSLLPQLQNALQLFYAGLEQLAAGGGGDGGGGTRELEVDGIPVTVVDKLALDMDRSGGSGAAAKQQAPAFELTGGGRSARRGGSVQFEVVEASAADDGGGSGAGLLAFASEEGSLHDDGPLAAGGVSIMAEAGPEGVLSA